MKVEMTNREEADNRRNQETPIIAKPIDNLPIIDMKDFLTKPCPKGVLIQCSIKRECSGFARFFPK